MKLAVKRTCRECPWKRDTPVGKFPPERYEALADTCDPHYAGFPQKMFACHMSPEGGEMACAGFLKVVGYDNTSVRLLARDLGDIVEDVQVDGELYGSFAEMAAANGWVPQKKNPAF